MTEQVSEDKALVPLYRGEADKAHPLARYGESRVVRALADRIEMTDRRKEPLTHEEAILTAQAAIVYRLDPFMGEIWSWVQKYQGRRVLTIMKGRDGTLKIAKKNAVEAGTYLLPPRFEMIPDDAVDRKKWGIPDGALAVWCFQQDKLSVDLYYSRLRDLKDAGFTPGKIEARLGDEPTDIGLGLLTEKEMSDLDKGHNKMTHIERVQKRAQMAALRKRWAAQEFEDPSTDASIDTDDYIIAGEWMELDTSGDELPKTPEEAKAKAATSAGTLFPSDDRMVNQWEQDVLEKLVELKVVQAKPHAVNRLNHSQFFGEVPIGELKVVDAIAWNLIWNEVKEKHPDTEVAERAELVNHQWRTDNKVYISRATDLIASLD